jgi:probable rRNA maturation factor
MRVLVTTRGAARRRAPPRAAAPRVRAPKRTLTTPRRREISGAAVRRAAEAMLRALGLSSAELSILLCGDRDIHALNRDYRGRDKPTDVLAFAMREGVDGDRAGDILGDVVISIETAARQAASRKTTLFTEVLTLLAHGLLHLLGWDHVTAAEDRRMRREVARLVVAARGGDRSRHRGDARSDF